MSESSGVYQRHGDSFHDRNAVSWVLLGLVSAGQQLEAITSTLLAGEPSPEAPSPVDELNIDALLGLLALTRRVRELAASEAAHSTSSDRDIGPELRGLTGGGLRVWGR